MLISNHEKFIFLTFIIIYLILYYNVNKEKHKAYTCHNVFLELKFVFEIQKKKRSIYIAKNKIKFKQNRFSHVFFFFA